MITREELIEKMKNVGVHCKTHEEAENVLSIASESAAFREKAGLLSHWNTYKSETYYCLADAAFGKTTSNIQRRKIITSTEFLSYFNTEETLQDRIYNSGAIKLGIDEPLKPITKREYLLNLISTMEANKKEFNQTVDKRIEALQKNLCCDGCYIQEDGQYKINESRVSSKSAVEVAEFINRMEADFE